MSGESGPVITTGPNGGLVFAFMWTNVDPLSHGVAPLRYGRVDIDYGPGLCDGIIREVTPALAADGETEIENTWELAISVGPEYARLVQRAIERSDFAVRVRS